MSLPAIAVVGVGHMGALHAQKLALLADEGVLELAGVLDRDAERAAAVAGPLGVPVFDDLAQVIGRADAVCLAVPTSLHSEIAERLLRSGTDVLVEKPMATCRADARRLIDVAREHGCVLQVGHIERFSQAFRKIRPVIRRPRFIEAHRLGPYSGRATDAGVVLDLMIHDLDIVSTLAGAGVERVDAIGIPVLSLTDDIANARLRFAGGCVANLTASRVSAERLRKIRLFQSDAYISIDFAESRITVIRRDGRPGDDEAPKIHAEQIELDEDDALLAQDRAFASAVRARSAPEVSGEDGYRALDLALRIQEGIPPLEELE